MSNDVFKIEDSFVSEIYDIIKDECPETASLMERQWFGDHLNYIKYELKEKSDVHNLLKEYVDKNPLSGKKFKYILASEIIGKRLSNNVSVFSITDDSLLKMRKEYKNLLNSV